MDSSPDEAAIAKLRAEVDAAVREILSVRPVRYGWKRSALDQQQVEYIVEREAVIQAVLAVQRVCWQSIHCGNQELALKIRENALHSLATLVRAMTLNEERIL
jgi:hypothetical protein